MKLSAPLSSGDQSISLLPYEFPGRVLREPRRRAAGPADPAGDNRLGRCCQNVGKKGDFEREPHRNRTCNLLIKSLTLGVLTHRFTYKLERLCQLPKTCFVLRIPVSYVVW